VGEEIPVVRGGGGGGGGGGEKAKVAVIVELIVQTISTTEVGL